MIVRHTNETWIPETKVKIQAQIDQVLKKMDDLGTPDSSALTLEKDQKGLLWTLCNGIGNANTNAFPNVMDCFTISPFTGDFKDWKKWKENAKEEATKGFQQVLHSIVNWMVISLKDNSLPLKASRFHNFAKYAAQSIVSFSNELLENCRKR
jgi:hypothetical protein